jgi:hypothetical protein
MRSGKTYLSAIFAVLAVLSCTVAPAVPLSIDNLTGLPSYPHLDRAVMDDVFRAEELGRWCARFTASTSDSLSAVEDWYRKILARASETDLSRDEHFAIHANLSGIKLALGVDYVAVYRLPYQPTIIELHRCSRPNG